MKTTVNQYEKQASDFLAAYGITMTIRRAADKAPPWAESEGPHGNHYRVALTHPDRKPLRFDFWGSINDRKALALAEENLRNLQLQMRNTEPHVRCNYSDLMAEREQAVKDANPTPYDVLACISGDIYTPDTFKDFCAEYGYDEDSRKALATFKRCTKFAANLRSFFPDGPEREALAEIQ